MPNKANIFHPILKDCNEKAIHNDTEKATLLNNFFSSCFNDAYLPLNMYDYNQLSQPDQCSCPEELLYVEDEIWKCSRQLTQPSRVDQTAYAETNSYQHCSWNYKAHEHVNLLRKNSPLPGKHRLLFQSRKGTITPVCQTIG